MDRLRFLRQYLANRPVSLEKRKWAKQMMEETRKRGTLYVAPWGVVRKRRDVEAEDRMVRIVTFIRVRFAQGA